MMQQYVEMKKKATDSILFFRLGDFYEMFFEDAHIASRELEITLTGRDCGLAERAPMCGVPFHAANGYIQRLIEKGYKVAVCEQIEDASVSKGLVQRDITKIITPGTVIDTSMLEEKKNNYLMTVFLKQTLGLALVDITTGTLFVSEIIEGDLQNKLQDEVAKYQPAELIVHRFDDERDGWLTNFLKSRNCYRTNYPDERFSFPTCIQKIEKHFKKQLTGNLESAWIPALGALLSYLEETAKMDLLHITDYQVVKIESTLRMDVNSRRNLELVHPLRGKSNRGTLLWVMDKTQTAMGGRLLRQWIEAPLVDVQEINTRLDAVEELNHHYMNRVNVRVLMRKMYDLERFASRIVLNQATPRDFVALKKSLEVIPEIKETIGTLVSNGICSLNTQIAAHEDIVKRLDRAILPEPSNLLKEGEIIQKGYDELVDSLKLAAVEGKQWILNLESEERQKTGIKNLKVSYNKVFGYYFEVTKSYYAYVPAYFIRKQTLANCERFVTDELKNLEERVLGAEEKLKEREYQLFLAIREALLKEIPRLRQTAKGIAVLDVYACLAEVAYEEKYTKPIVDREGVIAIQEGRHPVVEKMIEEEGFVPNDTLLDVNTNRVHIITGPNMAGKSTYMRQVALIVLLAQMGSFVPAQYAKIGIVDQIFTRIGASDDLAGGMSTFMVEMTELANILQHATKKSLILLDEIGRGTSTYDGMAIAWSVVEHISNLDKMGSKTLFATHYHELTELQEKTEGVQNFSFTAQEKGDDLCFLRKIQKGGLDGSFGIQVAKLAGVPRTVIYRAKEILADLEKVEFEKWEKKRRKKEKPIEGQIDLLSLQTLHKKEYQMLQALRDIELSKMTPLDAMNTLYEFQQKLQLTKDAR